MITTEIAADREIRPVAGDRVITRPPEPAPRQSRGLRDGALVRCLVFVWKWLVGAVLCTSALLAVLVVGWTGRLMRRTTVKAWHRVSGTAAGQTFEQFCAGDERTRDAIRWPNWIIANDAKRLWSGDAMSGAGPRRMRAAFGSLIENLRLGAAMTLNTWALTLPGCALWLFAWEFGWNVSFHKVYEQAGIGALTGLAGSLLFVVAMMYVPLAQARQAATDDWRAFYDFKLVWRLIRRRWWACLALAAVYGLLSVPVMVLRIAPKFFDRLPNYAQIADDPAALIAVLDAYFFYVSVFLLAAYVTVRIMAARVYAAATASCVRDGSLAAGQLGERERSVLDRLDMLAVEPPPRRHAIVRAAGWTGSLAGRWTAGVLTVVIWLLVVASIFVADFFNHIGGMNWLNQPLVQLPWLKYVPPALYGG